MGEDCLSRSSTETKRRSRNKLAQNGSAAYGVDIHFVATTPIRGDRGSYRGRRYSLTGTASSDTGTAHAVRHQKLLHKGILKLAGARWRVIFGVDPSYAAELHGRGLSIRAVARAMRIGAFRGSTALSSRPPSQDETALLITGHRSSCFLLITGRTHARAAEIRISS